MDVKKTELKDTKLNSIVLSIEHILEESNIEEKSKCNIMLGVTGIVTECVKNPPSFEDGKDIHMYCRPYAIKFAELDDNSIIKMMADLFLS